MKKFPILFPILIFALLFINTAKAQNLDNGIVKKLISENSSGLNLTNDDIQNSIISSAYHDKLSSLDLVYVQQSFAGLPVYNTIQVMAFKKDRLVSTSGGRIYRIEDRIENKRTVSSVPASEAVVLAARSVGLSAELQKINLSVLRTSADNQKVEFAQNTFTSEPITTDKMWVQDSLGGIRLSWQVRLVPSGTSDYWLIRVDAQSGAILGKDNLTVFCDWSVPHQRMVTDLAGKKLLIAGQARKENSQVINSASYRVIPYPAAEMNSAGGAFALETNPWTLAGTGNNATTLNWQNDGSKDYDYTRGNNVWAKEDTLGNNGNGGPATSTTSLPDLTFDFPFDPAQGPKKPDNEYSAITNLFYWNNIMHDLSYQYGFDEPAGNFQNSNLERGGSGNDFVLADAQDGSGRNNANFSTPADGQKPRMQMFLFDGNPTGKLTMNAPAQYAGIVVTSLEGAFSTANQIRNVGPVTGDLVLYNDDASGTTHLACGAPANASQISGKIAVIDRGNCDFTVKVKNAQNAGALAVIVVSADNTITTMGGSDNSITIPAVMIFHSDGEQIKSIMAFQTVNVTLKSTIDLDGDLDNTVITHEYTHGISNRLTGGPALATCLMNNEQMGEGWSDYMALMATTDWSAAAITDGTKPRPIGTYVLEEDPVSGQGIRKYPYSTDMAVNPWTYGQLSSISGSEEHYVGEIWAATLWDMTWNIIQVSGINTNLFNAGGTGGNSDALKLVILGMKLQPCSPGFLDGRDAILKADQILFNGKYSCAIWDAFARRGMGINSSEGSAYSTTDQKENFDIPSGAVIHKSVDLAQSPMNGLLNYTFTVTAQCQQISGLKVVDTLASEVTYQSGGTYNSTDRTVTFSIPDLQPQQTATFNLEVMVNPDTFIPETNLFSESVPANSIPETFTTSTNKTGINWGTSTINHSSPRSLKSAATGSPAEQILTVTDPVHVTGHVQLSFWQMISSEPGKDGGVVELSTDGTHWIDAGPYMAQNGYNSTIHTNSSLNNKPAFSGTSNNSFFQTVVNLSEFSDQNVYYRFRYVTDSTGSSLGWYIDDIAVTQYSAVYNIARVMNSANAVYSLSDTITEITSYTTVPVVWDHFTVQKDGHSALMKWTTSSEGNTDRFYIERSLDGIHFEVLGSVKAAGNSTLVNEYSFTDQSPASGNNFYRIRLTDKDGNLSYSAVKSLGFDEPGNSIVRISPNPGRNEAELFIRGNRSALKVRVFDVAGRLLSTQNMNSERLKISLSAFAEGVYFIEVKGGGMDFITKWVKEK